MGYYVHVRESNAIIPAENLDEAYRRMCALNVTHDHLKRGGSYSGGRMTAKWFSWMDENYPETCKDAAEILEALGFECDSTDAGGLDVMYYDNKSGQEDLFISAIADLFVPGSFIHWQGEDGEQYRWEFDEGGMTVKNATLIWE